MISGAKIPDNSLRDIQGVHFVLYMKTLLSLKESLENDTITLDKAIVVAMFGYVKKAIMLVGDTSAQVSSKHRE